MRPLPSSVALLSLCSCSHGFIAPQQLSLLPATHTKRSSPLFLAKKKGFSQSSSQKTPKERNKEPAAAAAAVTPPIAPTPSEIEFNKNAGQRALAQLREEAAQKQRGEIEKIREIRSVDEFIREDPTAAAIPEKVAMRMGRRMLPFVGVPLFGGMAAFVAFWYFATYKNVQFQPALVAFTTIGLLAIGLLGITYSVMSASWDPDREGSAMGFDEFSNNIENLKSGLKRSRENAVVRDQMAAMPEEDIQKAIRDLEKKDEKERMKTMSLQDKINRELE